MFLFLAGIFPLALLFYFLHGSNRNLLSLKASITGALCGIAVCINIGFFDLSPDLISASFLPNFLDIFFFRHILVLIIPFFILAFFSRTRYIDALKINLHYIFPLSASFYAFFLPMLVIANAYKSIYEIFALPPLYLLFSYTLSRCARAIETIQASVVFLFLLVGAALLAASQTFRLIDADIFRYAVCAGVFCVLALVMLVICKANEAS